MKHQKIVKVAAVLLLGSLVGCTKPENEVALATANEVKIVDGRLVFKDTESFRQTVESLKTKSENELTTWERSLNFNSLRNGSSEGEENLKQEFGFPSLYSAVINPEGEYQIGDKLYWYHAGQKHQFNSITDLHAARQGKVVPHITLVAGYKKLASKASSAGARTIESNLNGRVGEYQREFCLWEDYNPKGECKGVRKIVYETIVYTDQVPYTPTYYSVLYLAAKLEFRDSKRRFKVAGEPRIVDLKIYGVAKCGLNLMSVVSQRLINLNFKTETNYDQYFVIADAYVFAPYNVPSEVIWDYTINGKISSWIVSDPGNTYAIQGNNLW
jgi:hypothetical protein